MFSIVKSSGYLVACILMWAGSSASAQEGFPLDGTWRGDWGLTAGERKHLVLVMKWDGTNINGVINPGPGSVEFKSAVLIPEKWLVHIEADDAQGTAIIIDGRLNNIGSYNRTINGTWTMDGMEYSLSLKRQ